MLALFSQDELTKAVLCQSGHHHAYSGELIEHLVECMNKHAMITGFKTTTCPVSISVRLCLYLLSRFQLYFALLFYR